MLMAKIMADGFADFTAALGALFTSLQHGVPSNCCLHFGVYSEVRIFCIWDGNDH